MFETAPLASVATERGILIEGIVWDADNARVTWVDIELGRLYLAAVDSTAPRVLEILELGDQLGCAVPAVAGGWVCGLGRSLARVDEDGTIHATPALLEENERFNDGHADPQGRLVIGTLNSNGPDGRQLLLRLEHDGGVTLLDDEIGISNGIAWSPDGRWMYHVDTAARTVTRRSYGDEPGPPAPFVTVDGMPDGIAVDADGRLWVTVFDRGQVDCYDPSGTPIPELTIVVPDAHVASVGFGGPELDVLLIATGMPIMQSWLRRRRARDGWLFSAPSPVRGLPTHRWIPAELPEAIRR